ncbi:hypothetical protein HMPREF0004_1325 [Achromobacter piechaudii ATCC 43553]|uniref:Uncharacterized protein n=1 Tax=Achromobacter piechaudii ATCC 43553 TaxID=742159 RepID=D4X778_9BURK|nr:hypothetical protein HMPREF0004_1325 [Achromobacter piechaudii ATCC 43553]
MKLLQVGMSDFSARPQAPWFSRPSAEICPAWTHFGGLRGWLPG